MPLKCDGRRPPLQIGPRKMFLATPLKAASLRAPPPEVRGVCAIQEA